MARILAVDDSPAMRQMVSVTLRSAGHEVTEAVDGVAALNIAQKQPPMDLVITDVNMPNMDGITLVRELRQLSHYRGVPLLVLTTEASTQKKQEGKAAGATGWIVKPFNPERLLATVARVVGP
jgi:two-component system, chemotaxis family, chemotaxis protein CheY